MKAKVDLSALKQLSNIELFLLLCGTITVSSAVTFDAILTPQQREQLRQNHPLPGRDDQAAFQTR